MPQYRVVKPCYLPQRGGLRHVPAGVVVTLDATAAAKAGDHLQSVKSKKAADKPKAEPVSQSGHPPPEVKADAGPA